MKQKKKMIEEGLLDPEGLTEELTETITRDEEEEEEEGEQGDFIEKYEESTKDEKSDDSFIEEDGTAQNEETIDPDDLRATPGTVDEFVVEPVLSDFPYDNDSIGKMVDIPPDLLLEMKRVKWPKGTRRLFPEVISMVASRSWESIHPVPSK